MGRIRQLDAQTANMIAAGEVVERPMGVVKELVENAIDSGATAITVEIKGGGIDMIRVTDNGSGIEKSQIRKAFKRHATSKLKSIEDLFSIHSLGFRGEALSSISSVAQVDMITKTKDELVGTRYCINGGEEAAFEEIGAPDGTTLIIRNLFFNTPARKKFLKTPQTEGSYIGDVMEHMALDNPTVSVHYINNKDELVIDATVQGTKHSALMEIYMSNDFMPTDMGVTVDKTTGEKLENAGLNTLLGMGMAFTVLIIISLIISLFPTLFGGGRKKKESDKEIAEKAMDNTISQIAEQEDLSNDAELVAVIAAAIAAYEGSGSTDGFRVRSIRKVNTNWRK